MTENVWWQTFAIILECINDNISDNYTVWANIVLIIIQIKLILIHISGYHVFDKIPYLEMHFQSSKCFFWVNFLVD